jgi:hypothetical protein
MVTRYHWGYGVGHTYAFGANSGVADALLLAEIEEQENNTSRQEIRLEDEDSLLGEDDMVYQNDSNDNMSEGDIDDEVCNLYGRLLSMKVLITFIVTIYLCIYLMVAPSS